LNWKALMRRVVSLHLPTWPTDRLRRRLGKAAPPVETPVAILGRDGRRQVVLAADRSARAAGLVAGMAAAQARAVCADLVVFPADAAGDADALDRLALWALRLYAPVAAADAPDGLVIDVTGAAGRYGGERGLLDDMMKRLRAGAGRPWRGPGARLTPWRGSGPIR
jgi:protein ImuB